MAYAKVRLVTIAHPITRALFEIYAAQVLGTEFNDFVET